MPVVFIRHIGANLAFIAPVEGPVDPGWGVGGGYIDNTLPGGPVHPWLPGHGGGGHIDNTLPGAPGHPDARPPSQPPAVAPGEVLVMVRDAAGTWHYASMVPGTPPPRPVPVPPRPPQIGGGPATPPGTVTPPIAETPAPKK